MDVTVDLFMVGKNSVVVDAGFVEIFFVFTTRYWIHKFELDVLLSMHIAKYSMVCL